MEKFEIKEEFDIEVKRFYLPIEVERKCPQCYNPCKKNLGEDYLSYPVGNKVEPLHFYCDVCDTEFEADSILKISMEVGEEVRKI